MLSPLEWTHPLEKILPTPLSGSVLRICQLKACDIRAIYNAEKRRAYAISFEFLVPTQHKNQEYGMPFVAIFTCRCLYH